MSASMLLGTLDRVRPTGSGRWLACCPAHEDRSPSLSVRELDDGRVLVKCFGGCETGDVLASVGLDFDALFPERRIENVKRERTPFGAVDVLRALRDEIAVIVAIASHYARGLAVSADDHARLDVAIERFAEGANYALSE